MKKIFILVSVMCLLSACKKDNTLIPPQEEQVILTSLSSTDKHGNPSTTFFNIDRFYLIFQMTNKTGKDQMYSWTGPESEIVILQNDTIISRQWYGYTWIQIINQGLLKSDSTLVNKWLAPFNELSSITMLKPGDYEADVFINLRFNDEVKIQRHQKISFNIAPGVIVKKPNIYLYPLTTRTITVKFEFPLGGRILESIPLYSNGWTVEVQPNGKINNQYDYLFYESINPDVYQYNSGWVVSRDTLTSFFSNNLLQYGFNEREKNDFVEYWIPLLKEHQYYYIYPQLSEIIEKVIRLNISEPPDNMLRLFFVIEGSENLDRKLQTPLIPKFNRSGFVVTEWGVVMKE